MTSDETKLEQTRMALNGVNEWFDDYMAREESRAADTERNVEPEIHKLMLLLLSRLYDYKLKTEDLFDLVRMDKILGLETVVGLLEDGETYTTELHQKQAPSTGRMGQWEHKLVCHRHEKPLVLQLCRLLRGFTLPASYFGVDSIRTELTEHDVNEFTTEMNLLLDITLKTQLVEKLSVACHECLFATPEWAQNDGDSETAAFDDVDHRSISCVHSFVQNLYFYATHRIDDFRQHLLADTLLIPRLILPYLDRSVHHALELNARAVAYNESLDIATDEGETPDSDEAYGRRRRREALARGGGCGVLENPPLVQGISASLRTLIIASFRAPPTRFMHELLRRLNPTESLLYASAFVSCHEYIFALLCLLNVNMGALDLSATDILEEDGGQCKGAPDTDDFTTSAEPIERHPARAAHALLHALARVHRQMSGEAQSRVLQTVTYSGSLPVSRDTPSFAAIMSVLLGGSSSRQLEYASGLTEENSGRFIDEDREAAEFQQQARAEAKQEAKERAEFFDSKRLRNDDKHSALPVAKTSESFRLLGDLPCLNQRKDVGSLRDLDIIEREEWQGSRPVQLHLELPTDNKQKWSRLQATKAASLPSKESFPTEFACAINGHMMKEPVR